MLENCLSAKPTHLVIEVFSVVAEEKYGSVVSLNGV